MSGGRVQRLANLRIRPQIRGGNELASELAGKDAIQPAQHLRRVMGAGHHRLHRHLIIAAMSAARNALSGDVSHEEAHPVLIDENKLVEITGDGGQRLISGVDTKALELGSAARKN